MGAARSGGHERNRLRQCHRPTQTIQHGRPLAPRCGSTTFSRPAAHSSEFGFGLAGARSCQINICRHGFVTHKIAILSLWLGTLYEADDSQLSGNQIGCCSKFSMAGVKRECVF